MDPKDAIRFAHAVEPYHLAWLEDLITGNYVAFEYAKGEPDWWYDIVDGLPNPVVKSGFIDVWDKPGLGITFNVRAAKKHLREEDHDFFD